MDIFKRRRRTHDVYRDVAAVRAAFDHHAEQACALTTPVIAGADLIRAYNTGRVQRAVRMPAPALEDLAERRAAADWTLPAASATALVRTERSN